MRHSGDNETSLGNTLVCVFGDVFTDACLVMREQSPHGVGNCWVCAEPYVGTCCAACAPADIAAALPAPHAVAHMLGKTGLYLGDDGLKLQARETVPDVVRKVDAYASVGLVYKMKLHDTEEARYNASFCSQLFYPTDEGSVLGPKLGRWIVRGCWWYDPPAYTEDMLRRMLKGDARARCRLAAHVPFLRLLWRRIAELVEDAGELKSEPRQHYALGMTQRDHEPNNETWAMVNERYGLTRQHEQEYAALLARITALPAIVNFAPFRRAIEVDVLEEQIDD